MAVNVHQVHMSRQANCARSAIGRILQFADTLCMSGKYRLTFMRQWRQHSGKTLVQVAEHLHMTHGNLSKIERGIVPYNQDLLESLADLYGCDPVDILIRDPSEPTNIWSIWDQAKPGERRQIEAVAEALVKGRTGTAG